MFPNFGNNKPIPVEFEFKGKKIKGILSEVFGAGQYTWFLTVDKRHWGQLIYTDNYGLRFYSNEGKELDEQLTKELSDVLIGWYE